MLRSVRYSVWVLLICFRELSSEKFCSFDESIFVCSSGIGGGGFMVIRVPPSSLPLHGEANTSGRNVSESEVWTINFREIAPRLSNKTMYRHDPMASRVGGLAVGVPGEIRGLQEAHQRWGTIPWQKLVEPSARLAEGWKVQKELARRIQARIVLIISQSAIYLYA